MNFDTAQRTYDAMLPPDDAQPQYTDQQIDDWVDKQLSKPFWQITAEMDLDIEKVEDTHVDELAIEIMRRKRYGSYAEKLEAGSLEAEIMLALRRAIWWEANRKINMGEGLK